ncbi:toxin-antitoxin (TA) system antitoxin [Chroococcidiopsis sp. FACHB-1243]|uniref:type II toxin-antitoxin system Phd/YefM family antitoxin n=1 Tax=Chroococcidiopsis sp. [FACHB-1243] TaxID=2692781 RepID=UPI00177AE922|nr:toxin-antitoxin (TA) system antitoxin [Chroococcidiopsis sp. [FACHB-1243]]MBD2309153.1 toxin-antitoxin (TA) system antitoxin [Chroococcidiopsis sp. [FACHB-1243]]
MTTKTVDIREMQAQLSELILLVSAGTEIILTDGSKPLARLLPFASDSASRIARLHTGAIQTSDDFDDLLPDNFWAKDN